MLLSILWSQCDGNLSQHARSVVVMWIKFDCDASLFCGYVGQFFDTYIMWIYICIFIEVNDFDWFTNSIMWICTNHNHPPKQYTGTYLRNMYTEVFTILKSWKTIKCFSYLKFYLNKSFKLNYASKLIV
jgi:hypothetical protein